MKALFTNPLANPILVKSWKLPCWDNLDWGQIPKNYPHMKIKGLCGVIEVDTTWKRPEPVLSRVVYDMMRRLSCENNYGMAQMGTEADDTAWLKLEHGVPIGCVTTSFWCGRFWLLGAWVKPEFRRTGVMTELWAYVKEKYGEVPINRPCQAMQTWMIKNNMKPFTLP